MIQARWRAALVTVLASLGVGCDVGKDCDPLDCQSAVKVVVSPKGDIWEQGEYELTVTFDDESESCSFELPKHVPRSDATIWLSCGPRVTASLYALSDCTGDCSLENTMELQLFLDATPRELSITLTRDGEVALSNNRTVEYEQLYPRGPECGGGCRQSSFSLVVGEDVDGSSSAGAGGDAGSNGGAANGGASNADD